MVHAPDFIELYARFLAVFLLLLAIAEIYGGGGDPA